MTRNFVPLLPLGLALASCQKDEAPQPQPVPVAKDFTVGYKFINQGDARLETVWLQTKTFYPNKNGSGNNTLSIHDNTYPHITSTQQVSHAASSETRLENRVSGLHYVHEGDHPVSDAGLYPFSKRRGTKWGLPDARL
jgi:hypothetical protein